jgi:hypothetical protein
MEVTEKKERKIPAATILTVIAAFLGGGLAGSVFTWYMNRPDATVVTYSIATTPFGSSEAASVVPNLKIQLGNENITSLFTHTIDFNVPKGPFIDQVDFAVTFPAGARVFGTRAVSPTSVQSIACTPIIDGLKCRIGPLSANATKPFRVIVANDRGEPPGVELTAKNVELLSSTEYLNKGKLSWWVLVPCFVLGMVGGELLWRMLHKPSGRKQ